MENQIKSKVKKRLAIYGTMFLLGTSSLNLVGCSDQIVKEPTKIEISNEEEILSTNEVISNEVSENSVVSENKVVSENETEEELPVHATLTEEERQMIRDLAYETSKNNPPPENGIYSPINDFDFDNMYGGKYKEYESCKNEFILEYNQGYDAVCGDDSYYNGTDYLIIADGDISSVNMPYCMAKVDIISIIYQSSSDKFWIITNYEGEAIIEPNTYVNMVNNNLIDEEITDFSVTSMRDYMIKSGFEFSPGRMNIASAEYMEKSLFNSSKTR